MGTTVLKSSVSAFFYLIGNHLLRSLWMVGRSIFFRCLSLYEVVNVPLLMDKMICCPMKCVGNVI